MVESQKEDLDKFLINNKTTELKNIGECSQDEQVINSVKLDDRSNTIQKEEEESNEKSNIDPQENQELNESNNCIYKNIYDPSQWININTKLRDLLVKKGPIRISDTNFSNNKLSRHFSNVHYFQILANGESYERKWLDLF